jgi:predicted small lipoprotein YifL
MKLLKLLPPLLLAFGLLAACGQKGPLYLPDSESAEAGTGGGADNDAGSKDEEKEKEDTGGNY